MVSRPSILCAAFSARQIAESARRSGIDALAVDFFGDLDLKQSARAAEVLHGDYPDGFDGTEADGPMRAKLAAAAALLAKASKRRSASKAPSLGENLALSQESGRRIVFIGEHRLTVDLAETGVIVDGADLGPVEMDWQRGRQTAMIRLGGETLTPRVDPIVSGFRLRLKGIDVAPKVYEPHLARLAELMPVKEAPDTSNLLLCPMPGVVVGVNVKAGDIVEKGQPLIVLRCGRAGGNTQHAL